MNTLTNVRLAVLADVTLNGVTGTVAKHIGTTQQTLAAHALGLAHLEFITPALAELVESFDEPLKTATCQAILKAIDGVSADGL